MHAQIYHRAEFHNTATTRAPDKRYRIFSDFLSPGVKTGPKFTNRGDDLHPLPVPVYHPAKFHRFATIRARHMPYKKSQTHKHTNKMKKKQ